jgi:hypothetical protein
MSRRGEQIDAASSETGDDPQPQLKRGELLEGEDPRTPRADDAMHWMTVYSELVSYTDGLLALATRQLNGAASTFADGLNDADGDTRVLRRRLAWYRRRLRFWAGRLSELRSG